MLTINGIDELKAHAGEDVGVSDWHEVTQAEVDAFADATGDHQWIHVDPERARDTPFGGTIAHGYYTLSLASRFIEDLLRVDGIAMMINYGLNKVRFPAPLPVGARVRMRLRLAAVDDVEGGAQLTSELTFERDGGEKPVCVAESLSARLSRHARVSASRTPLVAREGWAARSTREAAASGPAAARTAVSTPAAENDAPILLNFALTPRQARLDREGSRRLHQAPRGR